MAAVATIYGADLPTEPSTLQTFEWGLLGKKKRASKVVLPEPGLCQPYYKLDHGKLKLMRGIYNLGIKYSQHIFYI